MLRLYQFPISHYCEKARWALAYKGLEHQLENLLPGPHFSQVKKLAPKSSTPLLVHDGKTIQGSGEIITYLDQTFPVRPLTPEEPAEAEEALEWERFLDEEVGIHVRRLCYHSLLEHPKIVVPFLTHQGPWYGPLLYRFIFPQVRQKMRQAMKVDDEHAAQSKEVLDRATSKLFSHLEHRQFLVGDRFSRADLAAAALLAPLYRPKGYGLDWPERFPEPIESQLAEYRAGAPWVERMYAEYRAKYPTGN